VPNQTQFQTVPISEVVSPVTSIRVNGLEALIADDGEISAGSTKIRNHEVVRYDVHGLPSGHKAWIRQERNGCQLVLEVSGEAELLGAHASLQDALQALSNKLTLRTSA
jgi:hypothetical protein